MALKRQDTASEVFVNLTEDTKAAQINRRGYTVPPARVDYVKADRIIGDYTIVDPKSQPRVVSQSIRPGTKVAAGTGVDLVLAPKSAIPIDMFENTHASFRGKTVDQVDGIASNSEARRILLTYDNSLDLPKPEKDELLGIFNQNHVIIDDSKVETSFDAAFDTMRNVMAFQE